MNAGARILSSDAKGKSGELDSRRRFACGTASGRGCEVGSVKGRAAAAISSSSFAGCCASFVAGTDGKLSKLHD